MANFPNWTFTVSSGVKASSAAKALVTNYNLMESSLRQAMGAMPSIEAHRRALQSDDGTLSSGAYSHFYLGGISASQHHGKLHGTTHITSVDPIPVASAAGNGVMSSSMFVKLSGLSSTSNKKPIIAGRYVGTYNHITEAPPASQFVNLGFTPRLVKVQHETAAIGMWEVYNGCATVWFHAVTGAAVDAHYMQGGASTISIVTNGFTVFSTYCNQNTVNYYFMAIGV